MRMLRIEMNRGRGWELRVQGRIPASVSLEQIKRDLEAYALQYPHRALLDGFEVARVGAETVATSTLTTQPRSDLR